MSATMAVTGLLAASTGSALLRKVLYQMKVPGLYEVHSFEKPWFTTWESAAALWLSLLGHWLLRLWQSRGRRRGEDASGPEEEQPLLAGEADGETHSQGKGDDGANTMNGVETHSAAWREVVALAVPGIFSVASIIFQGYGLQYISASLSMMLSGSCIIFTAIASVWLLKRRLNFLHYSGVVLTLVGILIVSVANLVWPDMAHHGPAKGGQGMEGHILGATGRGGGGMGPGAGEAVLGIVLTLAAMLILAGRLVSEEFALEGMHLHPLQVLGYEGMWGTILVGIGLPIVWIIPGNDAGGSQENLWDSILMLYQSRSLNAINWLFFLSVVGLNIFGLMVTSQLGSVFRAVLLTSRTASVWALNLLLYYLHVGDGSIGESWRSPSSWCQLCGFILLLAGTIVYAQGSSPVAQVRSQKQEDPEDQMQEEQGPSGGQSEVTRLRPYTSLYIPPRSRRFAYHDYEDDPIRRRSQSVPRLGIMQAGGLLSPRPPAAEAFRSHSYTPGIPLTHSTSQGQLPGNSSSSASGLLAGDSPRVIDFDEYNGEEIPAGRSPNLFLETLMHRSSWIRPAPIQQPRNPRRPLGGSPRQRRNSLDVLAEEEGQPPVADDSEGSKREVAGGRAHVEAEAAQQAGSASGVHRPTFESPFGRQVGEEVAPSASERKEGEDMARSAGSARSLRMGALATALSNTPEPSSPPTNRNGSGGSQQGEAPVVQPEEEAGPPASGKKAQKPVLGQSPAVGALMEYRESAKKAVSQMPAVEEIQEADDEAAEEAPHPDQPGKGSGSPAVNVHPFLRERDREAASSSGSSNPPESRTTGSVFGQSPSPQVLLSRRNSSASKAKPALLPSFSEEERVEEEEAAGSESADVPSHALRMDSDSDISDRSAANSEERDSSVAGSRGNAANDSSEDEQPGRRRYGDEEYGSDSSSEERRERKKGTSKEASKKLRSGEGLQRDTSMVWSGGPMSL